ncbi:MAG: hypothetical protein ACYC4Q_00150 [Victivallaceae bacterium]
MSNLSAALRKVKIFLASPWTLFVLAVIMAFAVRTYVCNRELAFIKSQTGADFYPFFVESSIMYGFAKDVGSGKGIPACDRGLSGMDKVKVSEQMPLGIEYFLGYTWRIAKLFCGEPVLTPAQKIYEDDPDGAAFMRNTIRLWASLTAGFVFLWIFFLRCPKLWAMTGALIYVFAPAAIARYTGQDILCEDFAMPFLAAAFAFGALALRKRSARALIITGICAFCATAFWDMSQLCFLLWAVYEIIRVMSGGNTPRKRLQFYLFIYASLLLSAVLVPYNRAHQLLCSPLIMFIFPVLFALYFLPSVKFSRKLAVLLVSGLVFFGVWKLASSGYAGNYSHFTELLKAKIAFCNFKPADPDKLNFAARFLWTPSLHSASMAQTKMIFPAVLWIMGIAFAVGLCFKNPRRHLVSGFSRSLLPLWLTVIYFIIYILMVRFSVFCGVFAAVACPLIFYDLCRSKSWLSLRIILIIIAFLAICLEAEVTFTQRRNYPKNFLRETADLVKWFRRANIQGHTVLSEMTVSPVLKAYCGANIVVQPKFELPASRKIAEDYLMLLYHGSESQFAKFCADYGVEYVVFNCNSSFEPLHPYSYRYIAAAKKVDKNSTVFLMDMQPRSMRYFYELTPPGDVNSLSVKYRVFKFIPPQDKDKALATAQLAWQCYKERNMPLAEKLAEAAFMTDPQSQNIYLLYYKIHKKLPQFDLEDFTATKKK